MRTAIVRESDGYVLNIIVLEEDSDWPTPEGYYLVKARGKGSPGDTWDGNVFITPPPPDTDPSRSTHVSQLVSIDPTKARPAKVRRLWENRDYLYDCFVTETIKDLFVAGGIEVDDYVLVHYDAVGEQIVTQKIFKSWSGDVPEGLV